MYSVCAQVNDVSVIKCNLQVDDGEQGLFELRVKEVRKYSWPRPLSPKIKN
jgi:hypothetical protein